jgi:hypothetical protein
VTRGAGAGSITYIQLPSGVTQANLTRPSGYDSSGECLERGPFRSMIYFTCTVCRTHLSADDGYAGQLMRCPTCLSAQRVPARELVGASSAAPGKDRVNQLSTPRPAPPKRSVPPPIVSKPSGRRYGFNCPYCSSRLEANEALAGKDGQCPTCGSEITIPIQDRYGRLIDPKTRQIIKPDPHPVHAYAAAGERAPRVVRLSDGSQNIQCPKCATFSPVTHNNCRTCGMPFTMEGTTAEAAGASNGYCVASLVLGIISIPAWCTLITPALAIIFGIIGYNQASRSEGGGGKRMAIAGIICGVIGATIAGLMVLS